ncbi:MAG TPA: amylo-alpha-1,6-glucosidase [Clostridiales bacterium]|nr:amylo-alpha-1,6-glucosidase [Clostridiales bacterium]
MRFGKSEWSSFDRGIEREWLLTNGIGGFSSSTVIGASSRRYHGLLVASLEPPVERHLVLSQLHETVTLNGQEFSLSSFSTGNYINTGYLFQASFELDPLPVFTYAIADVLIEKTVSLVYGENTAVVCYRIITGNDDAEIKVAPLVNFRDYHGDSSKHHMKFNQTYGNDHTVIRPYDLDLRILVGCAGSSYEALDDCWFEGMYYPVESERGLNAFEDHYIPGVFRITAKAGSDTCFYFICTVCQDGPDVLASRAWNAGGYMDPQYGKSAVEAEIKRIGSLTAGCSDDFHRALVRSADHFIVHRRSTNSKTIIAGYPWFTDWGRDTMISLPGLTLPTGRYEDAADILAAFSRYVRHGLVPNMFPDRGGEPVYNTVDAALWYFEAICKYVEETGDTALVKDILYDSMLQIIDSYIDGTLYGIHMDEDMLIAAGSGDTQLTWMDAKAGDTVFTPRHGKAVEINALWYNALRVMENISGSFGYDAGRYGRIADRVKESFTRVFWYEEGKYLYDVVGGTRDKRVRPNQILAVSLSYPVIDGEMARQVVAKVWKELYTAYGLRTLSRDSEDYRGRYLGDMYQRDSAYHQGTVWPWLIGHFITAFARTLGRDPVYADMPAKFIRPFIDHMRHACIESISEIFDGDEPHMPRGCFAQAWSVAEVLRAYVGHVLKRDGHGQDADAQA